MEEQKLTAELAAVKMKKEDAIRNIRKWREGERREVSEGRNERKIKRNLGTKRRRTENTVSRELEEK